MAEPNFFIIGAARSGTTMLAEVLRQHPDVFVTQPKEPSFLAYAGNPPKFTDPVADRGVNSQAITRYDEYLALYGKATAIARGDASVSTLYWHERSIPNIVSYFPDARLVVSLRDPVERAYSNFRYNQVRGAEHVRRFEEALDLEEQRVAAGWGMIYHLTAMGMYSRQLRPFLEQFGAERILVLFYEDLARAPETEVRRVFAFLGVTPRPELDYDLSVNASGRPKGGLNRVALRSASSLPASTKTMIKRIVPREARERLRGRAIERVPMPEAARIRLEAVYREEKSELRSLLDRHYPAVDHPAWLLAR